MQLNVFEESEKRQQQCFKQMIEVKHKNDIAEKEKDTQFFYGIIQSSLQTTFSYKNDFALNLLRRKTRCFF